MAKKVPMLTLYQSIWEYLWLFIAAEAGLDLASIYALFRPFSGAFRFLNKINWGKLAYQAGVSFFVAQFGDLSTFDNFLVGIAPLTFSAVWFLIL